MISTASDFTASELSGPLRPEPPQAAWSAFLAVTIQSGADVRAQGLVRRADDSGMKHRRNPASPAPGWASCSSLDNGFGKTATSISDADLVAPKEVVISE
jgi:hypothetical protein